MFKKVLVLLILSSATELLAQPDVADLFESSVTSVVQIITYDATGSETALGSGFFIAPGQILTNAHVVGPAYSAEVSTSDTVYSVVTVLKMDEDVDLALVQVQGWGESFLILDTAGVYRPGDRVFAIGSPLGLENSFSDGMISAIRGHPSDVQIIQTTAPISHGSSGSPLLNVNGLVVGINSATAESGQNVNFAVAAPTIRRFLGLPDSPKILPVAGTSVWWRVAVKWVLNIVGVAIAFLFGPGWWVVIILFFVVYWIWLLLAWLFRLIVQTIRRR